VSKPASICLTDSNEVGAPRIDDGGLSLRGDRADSKLGSRCIDASGLQKLPATQMRMPISHLAPIKTRMPRLRR
jgi:hypothetical protein